MTRNSILLVVLFAVLCGIVSCNQHPAATPPPNPALAAPVGLDLKKIHVDYAKDPACGMPLKSGFEDTVTYQGKLYGFCSKECKAEFLKDPAGYVAKAK